MRLGALLLCSCFWAAMVAGCTGAEDPGAHAEGPNPAGPTSAATPAATGVLEGTVTDPEIQPLSGVSVGLVGENLSAVTDVEGFFRFEEVASKRHTVVANHPSFQVATETVFVAAGETTRVHLVAMPIEVVEVGDPVIETREFEGLMSCSVSTALVRLNPCQSSCLDELVSPLLPHHCTQGDPNDKSEIRYTIPENTKELILEVVLQPGLTGTTTMVLFTSDCTDETAGGEGCDRWGNRESDSPLRWVTNATSHPARFNFTGEKELRSDLWASWSTVPGVFWQARFTLYVTTSLYFEAPDETTGIPQEGS